MSSSKKARSTGWKETYPCMARESNRPAGDRSMIGAFRRNRMRRSLLSLAAAVSLAAADPKSTPPKPQADLAPLLAGLKARAIGPAVMGGRVSAIALDPKDAAVYYVGLGTGGIVKTTNSGATF